MIHTTIVSDSQKQVILEQARLKFADDSDCEIEIDDNASVTDNEDDGYWVQAFVFVRYTEAWGE